MKTIKNGGAAIQSAIDEACRSGLRQATIAGNYEIEKTVLVPHDFHLVLDNCYLVLADNTFCNMFSNENCRTAKGRTPGGCDRNIVIEGRGNTVLDGGNYNGLSERNSGKNGMPTIDANNMLLFANMENFSISGLHIRNQRWWGMNFLYCRHGHIHDIDFLSDCTMADQNGNRVLGLTHERPYEEIYIKNSDGIDLRVGCHDILIENITGVTEDDTIALTALTGSLQARFAVDGLPNDLYNVIIRNVNAAAFCSIVRLLNQGGTKLYNILIDGVYDASKNSPYLDRTSTGVRVGDVRHYNEPSPEDETYNITIRNVVTRAQLALNLAGTIRNLNIENISGFDGGGEEILNNATILR